MARVTAQSSTPWFLSFSSDLALEVKFSSRSGTFLTILIAQIAAFRLMYVLLDPMSLSISLLRSRDISSEAMLPKVARARPTTYMLEWFMSFLSPLVTSMSTLVFSSNSSMTPR